MIYEFIRRVASRAKFGDVKIYAKNTISDGKFLISIEFDEIYKVENFGRGKFIF